jgi:hypothetical protein
MAQLTFQVSENVRNDKLSERLNRYLRSHDIQDVEETSFNLDAEDVSRKGMFMYLFKNLSVYE